jgi:hypothetical protein
MAKKILNEATVRRFQKLANMSPINEMYANEQYMKEEEAEADLAPADDMDMGAPEGEEMGMGDEGEVSAEVAQGDIEDAKQGLENALDLLNQILPGDSAEDEELGAEDEMDPMDDAGMDDAGAEDDAADAIMEALSGISYQPSQSEIVNEVAQRVARRLQAAKLHEAKLNKALGRK